MGECEATAVDFPFKSFQMNVDKWTHPLRLSLSLSSTALHNICQPAVTHPRSVLLACLPEYKVKKNPAPPPWARWLLDSTVMKCIYTVQEFKLRMCIEVCLSVRLPCVFVALFVVLESWFFPCDSDIPVRHPGGHGERTQPPRRRGPSPAGGEQGWM